jgi:hypothetical protein
MLTMYAKMIAFGMENAEIYLHEKQEFLFAFVWKRELRNFKPINHSFTMKYCVEVPLIIFLRELKFISRMTNLFTNLISWV